MNYRTEGWSHLPNGLLLRSARPVWTILIESLIGGLFASVRPYLPYTAATALAGTPPGSANFGPSQGVVGVSALPFAGAAALLLAIAVAGALIAFRTTIRHDIT